MIKKILDFMILRTIIIYQKLPWPLNVLTQLIEDPNKYKSRKIILKMTRKVKNDDYELNEIRNYLKNNPLRLIPQTYITSYNVRDVIVHHEGDDKFVLYHQKRMYFPGGWSDVRIMKYFNWMLIETDGRSPHKYESDSVFVKQGDVVADVGSAEGFFALSVIDKARKIYLFECDEEWIPALKKTFKIFEEKVVIIKKYIADYTDEGFITLDEFFKDIKLDFIKADIEGMEPKLLYGAREILKNNDLRMTLCAYHNENDEDILKTILHNNNYSIELSGGYMIPPPPPPPDTKIVNVQSNLRIFLRHGVIRAWKENRNEAVVTYQ
jgi:hypothetical protein